MSNIQTSTGSQEPQEPSEANDKKYDGSVCNSSYAAKTPLKRSATMNLKENKGGSKEQQTVEEDSKDSDLDEPSVKKRPESSFPSASNKTFPPYFQESAEISLRVSANCEQCSVSKGQEQLRGKGSVAEAEDLSMNRKVNEDWERIGAELRLVYGYVPKANVFEKWVEMKRRVRASMERRKADKEKEAAKKKRMEELWIMMEEEKNKATVKEKEDVEHETTLEEYRKAMVQYFQDDEREKDEVLMKTLADMEDADRKSDELLEIVYKPRIVHKMSKTERSWFVHRTAVHEEKEPERQGWGGQPRKRSLYLRFFFDSAPPKATACCHSSSYHDVILFTTLISTVSSSTSSESRKSELCSVPTEPGDPSPQSVYNYVRVGVYFDDEKMMWKLGDEEAMDSTILTSITTHRCSGRPSLVNCTPLATDGTMLELWQSLLERCHICTTAAMLLDARQKIRQFAKDEREKRILKLQEAQIKKEEKKAEEQRQEDRVEKQKEEEESAKRTADEKTRKEWENEVRKEKESMEMVEANELREETMNVVEVHEPRTENEAP